MCETTEKSAERLNKEVQEVGDLIRKELIAAFPQTDDQPVKLEDFEGWYCGTNAWRFTINVRFDGQMIASFAIMPWSDEFDEGHPRDITPNDWVMLEFVTRSRSGDGEFLHSNLHDMNVDRLISYAISWIKKEIGA